jgi:hypothetical protein
MPNPNNLRDCQGAMVVSKQSWSLSASILIVLRDRKVSCLLQILARDYEAGSALKGVATQYIFFQRSDVDTL